MSWGPVPWYVSMYEWLNVRLIDRSQALSSGNHAAAIPSEGSILIYCYSALSFYSECIAMG